MVEGGKDAVKPRETSLQSSLYVLNKYERGRNTRAEDDVKMYAINGDERVSWWVRRS